MRLSFRHIFNLIVFVLLFIYVVTAMGYNSQARLMPLVVSIPILILAAIQTIRDFRTSRLTAGAPGKKETSNGDGKAPDKGRLKREINAFLWAISLFVALYLFGFILTTFFYTFLALKVRSRFGWKSSVGVSVACFAFLWIVMVYGFKVDLYPGSVILVLRKSIYGY